MSDGHSTNARHGGTGSIFLENLEKNDHRFGFTRHSSYFICIVGGAHSQPHKPIKALNWKKYCHSFLAERIH